jgi:hypothetical protein
MFAGRYVRRLKPSTASGAWLPCSVITTGNEQLTKSVELQPDAVLSQRPLAQRPLLQLDQFA